MKKWLFFCIVFCAIIIGITLYYKEKLMLIFQDPEYFSTLFLQASGIATFSIGTLFLNIALAFSAFAVEAAIVGWKQSAIYRILFKRTKSTIGDIWCWLLSVLNLYDLCVLLFSFGFFYAVCSVLSKNIDLHLFLHIDSIWLQFVILLLLNDFKHYIWHWTMHKYPFWHLHKYHHSATELNLITTTRGHFLEKGVNTIFDAVLFIIVGAPAELFFGFIFIREFYQYLLHADLNWHLGWVGRHVLISPIAHKIHHSSKKEHFDKNFGTLFIFWDKLFGTYTFTKEKLIIGIQDEQINSGFWLDMKQGAKDFMRSFIRPFC